MDELLAACVASPADDMPRFEWANRVGGARGELVAVQCALARGELPRHLALDRRRREAEILATNEAAFADLEGLAVGYRFRRGFVEDALVSPSVFATRGEELFRRAPLLQRLQLAEVDDATEEDVLRAVDAVIASPWFARVKKLRIARAGRWVDTASDYNPRDFVSAGSAVVTRLVEAKALAGLVGLELPRNGLSSSDVAKLVACPEAKGLRALDLGNQEIGRYVGMNGDHVWSLVETPNLDGVEELDVSGAFGVAPMLGGESRESRAARVRARAAKDATFFAHPRVVGLRKLVLADVSFSDEAAVALAKAPFTRLEALDLSKNVMGSADWTALGASPGFAKLRELTFDGPCKYVFDVKQARALGDAPFPSLRILQIDA